jgi:hypothetical protein
MSTIPWIGLAALLAMFVIPFLPSWLFEGPRTIKHRPRRRICGDCGAPWIDDHDCGRLTIRRWPASEVCGDCGAPWTDDHRCGPLTITRWPASEVCGSCGAPWTSDHRCAPGPAVPDSRLRADLRRPQPGTDLQPQRSGQDDIAKRSGGSLRRP